MEVTVRTRALPPAGVITTTQRHTSRSTLTAERMCVLGRAAESQLLHEGGVVGVTDHESATP
eukprot:1122676-Prymnesium_polylepis.1